MMVRKRVFGRELKVGDVIEVWFEPHRVQILCLEEYTGPIAYVFKHGARIATFLVGPSMTIDLGDLYTVVSAGR